LLTPAQEFPAFQAVILGSLLPSVSWVDPRPSAPTISGSSSFSLMLCSGTGEIIQQPALLTNTSRSFAPPGTAGHLIMGLRFFFFFAQSEMARPDRGWFGGTLVAITSGSPSHQPEGILVGGWTRSAPVIHDRRCLWVYDRYFRVAAAAQTN